MAGAATTTPTVGRQNLKIMVTTYNAAHLADQTRATRALLKFREDHSYNTNWLDDIRECLGALERGDMQRVIENFRRVPIGSNGCFNDWWPPVVFPNETQEHALAVFEALTANWSPLMTLPVKGAANTA